MSPSSTSGASLLGIFNCGSLYVLLHAPDHRIVVRVITREAA